MPAHTLDRQNRSLTPLLAVTAAALVFTVLLVLVRLQWRPLESVDHGAAARINGLVAGHPALVAVVKAVTWLGSDGVLWAVIGASALLLAFRRRWRLVLYLLVTGAGALVMDPVLKSLVGRLRPVLAHPIAHGNGSSFPSGHSLGSIVCYGAVLLVFLPATRPATPPATPPANQGRGRTVFTAAIVALVALIGISRILLGVHYLSDVAGGWTLGITWLGITAFAFELARRAEGQPVTGPLAEGLEPGARADLDPVPSKPAQPEAPVGKNAATRTVKRSAGRERARVAAGVVVAWVLILGVIVGFGELVVKYSHDKWLGDTAIPRWFAAHRTPTLNQWSNDVSVACATTGILIVAVAACVIFLAVTRHWRPVIFLAVVMFGELAAFLAAAAVVRRPRPYVHHLDHHLPTSAYPSGHMAATCCLYIAIAIVVIGHARGWWRWLFGVPAIVMPVAIALSRMYRGEHHPTDITGSIIFAALWLTATTLLIRPNAELPHRSSAQAGSRLRSLAGRTVSRPRDRAAAT
ncbi:MAG: phosphatase PAP2 family protein [Streptosporangiaceae bacterium]